MPVRRLNAHPVVVVTGVENSGKTTLAKALALELDWPLVAEAARTMTPSSPDAPKLPTYSACFKRNPRH